MIEPTQFRRVMGRLATGVTVVTTVQDGMDHAMTANAITSLSLEPALLLVCVETDSRFCDAVLDTGFWGVSVLTEQGRRHAAWLATKGRPLEGQLLSVPFDRGPQTGAPLLRDSLCTLECRTTAVHEEGDHQIVVGAVVGTSLDERADQPLLYFASGYHALGERSGRY